MGKAYDRGEGEMILKVIKQGSGVGERPYYLINTALLVYANYIPEDIKDKQCEYIELYFISEIFITIYRDSLAYGEFDKLILTLQIR